MVGVRWDNVFSTLASEARRLSKESYFCGGVVFFDGFDDGLDNSFGDDEVGNFLLALSMVNA